jgi:hypothetical protein
MFLNDIMGVGRGEELNGKTFKTSSKKSGQQSLNQDTDGQPLAAS